MVNLDSFIKKSKHSTQLSLNASERVLNGGNSKRQSRNLDGDGLVVYVQLGGQFSEETIKVVKVLKEANKLFREEIWERRGSICLEIYS